jgi:hypothetical protein
LAEKKKPKNKNSKRPLEITIEDDAVMTMEYERESKPTNTFSPTVETDQLLSNLPSRSGDPHGADLHPGAVGQDLAKTPSNSKSRGPRSLELGIDLPPPVEGVMPLPASVSSPSQSTPSLRSSQCQNGDKDFSSEIGLEQHDTKCQRIYKEAQMMDQPGADETGDLKSAVGSAPKSSATNAERLQRPRSNFTFSEVLENELTFEDDLLHIKDELRGQYYKTLFRL